MANGPRYILGISAFYHDSAGALLRDGEIVAAAQEERFTRKKGDAGFPLTPRPIASGLPASRQWTSSTSASTTNSYSSSSAFSRGPSTWRRGASDPFAWQRHRGSKGVAEVRGRGLVRRASRVSCRERVLPLALPRGSHSHDGRRGRVGDSVSRSTSRQRHRAFPGAPLARFAGAVVLGVHLLHRLQAQLRGIQGHGARAV